MTRRRQSRGLAVLAAAALTIALAGVVLDRAGVFPRLRFAIQRGSTQLASTRAVPLEAIARGLPIMSIYMDPGSLRDLLEHKLEHGRAWERPADISYFTEGTLQFATRAGVRIHGGGSRLTSPRQGFRLYFRRQYGATRFREGLPFPDDARSHPLQRLIVHNDVRYDRNGAVWRLVNPLAYDVAARLGGITPATQPAALYVNGEDYGLYVLMEHFDDEYFESHLPGQPIRLDVDGMGALDNWVRRLHPPTAVTVSERIDLDNLTRWFLAAIFNATRDAYQGPGQLYDESRQKWFYVTFDLDQSYRDWDLDSYLYLLERVGEPPRARRLDDIRPRILTALLGGDAAYRSVFAAHVDRMLNHLLTPEFLEERRAYYEGIATAYDVPERDYLGQLREFFARRPDFVREITEQWLNTPPSVPVTAERVDGGPLVVDGFPVEGRYEGRYLAGDAITVALPDGERTRWFVNGELTGETDRLRLTADRPAAILAVPGTAGVAPVTFPPVPAAPVVPPLPAPARLEWVPITGGPFMMGCAPGDSSCTNSDLDRHQAVAPASFALTRTEVTVAQYDAFARASGERAPTQPRWNGADHPVVNVTFDEARRFCAWAGGRLPTEVEWEFAARAGRDGARFAWDGPGARQGPPPVNAQGTNAVDVWPQTAPVGSFAPNAFGLLDMTGNVWEWTDSWFPRVAQLREPRPGSAAYLKTVRGGSWDSRLGNLRLSRRVGLSPLVRPNLYVGFRCAR